MIKQTVEYVDYNGNAQKEDLYFHAPKHILMDHLDLREQMERLSETLEGDGSERELGKDEVNEILQLVKRFIKMSYGARVDGGRKFRQTEELWIDFTSSAVYDAFLWGLFQNPEKAFQFMRGIMPDDLIEASQAQQALDAGGRKMPSDFQKKQQPAATQPKLAEVQSVEFDDADVTGEESKEEKAARLRAELESLEG